MIIHRVYPGSEPLHCERLAAFPEERREKTVNPVNETVQSELDRIDEEIRKAKDEERYYRHQIKILRHKGKELDRNARDHRIYTRGGMLEKFLRAPLLLTNDHVFRILQEAFHYESVRNLESKLIAEVTEALAEEAESEETG